MIDGARSQAAPSAAQKSAAAGRPEIVLGIVSPIGVDLDPVCEALSDALDDIVRYETESIRISQLIAEWQRPEDECAELPNRWRTLMNAWRSAAGSG